MKLPTKSRYAVMAIVEIALNSKEGPLTLQAISISQNIALSYLEQIFMKLRTHKIVYSIKGPGGGYLLSRPLNKISIADIIKATDHSMKVTRCNGKSGCLKNGIKCLTHDIWNGLEENMIGYLESISLSNVVSKYCVNKESDLVN